MKKLAACFCAFAALGIFAGCAASDSAQTTAQQTTISPETTLSQESVSSEAQSEYQETVNIPEAIRVASLKGPTSIGIIDMMYNNHLGEYGDITSYSVLTMADEVVTGLAKKEIDIALLPANVASVYYNKSEGGITVLDINTLGVLYIVENGETVNSISDLSGKTIYVTGKGTTPDYCLQYLLNKNGLSLSDVNIEYESEASAIVARLTKDTDALGLLPQPFVTASLIKNADLRIALDMSEEWDKVSDYSLVTGVTVVRTEFLKEYPDAVNAFMDGHKDCHNLYEKDIDYVASLCEDKGIVSAAVAKKAIPYCNITYIEGEELKKTLSNYLSVLYEFAPESIGGKLPEDDFYYKR